MVELSLYPHSSLTTYTKYRCLPGKNLRTEPNQCHDYVFSACKNMYKQTGICWIRVKTYEDLLMFSQARCENLFRINTGWWVFACMRHPEQRSKVIKLITCLRDLIFNLRAKHVELEDRFRFLFKLDLARVCAWRNCSSAPIAFSPRTLLSRAFEGGG